MKKILVNASPCAIGGSVQVSLGFIRQAMAEAGTRGWSLFLAVTPAIASALGDEPARAGVPMEVFTAGPGSAFGGRATRARLKALCFEWGADMVFTVFGPSYVRFGVPEYMGFADGFAIIPMVGCYANHPLKFLPTAWFKANAKRLFLRTADAFWVESETAKRGMISRAGISSDKVDVVPNGVNGEFAAALKGASPAPTGDMLLLGAGYPHKNHALVVPTAKLLDKLVPGPWRFVFTLPVDSPSWQVVEKELKSAGLAHRAINLGVLNLSKCAEAYEASTLIFHPSLLEIFSAGYVESMAARRPLAASDRPFAREICGEAAAYFDPLSPESAAKVLARLLTDADARNRLVEAGARRLPAFPDASAKNGKLCDLIDAFALRYCKK